MEGWRLFRICLIFKVREIFQLLGSENGVTTKVIESKHISNSFVLKWSLILRDIFHAGKLGLTCILRIQK
jgi:hypothetical protein